MRVVLVGDPDARADLRARLAAARLEIVGEATTLADARARYTSADAFLVAASPDSTTGNSETLTPRELEVLRVLAEGLPNKAIARRLGISDQTVKFHLASICGKLGAVNRTDAVRRAIQQGLITV
jgi:DNA-binding NarL/FixJ family response regulator